MLKKLISTAVITSCLTSAVQAESVSISKDNHGDFLIAPYYEAKDKICSNIKVMNTNETNSILAKVTIREQIHSQEIDLPIFLSPGDVWDGKICEDNSKILLKSFDDSNHPELMDKLKKGIDLNRHSRRAGHDNIDFSKGYIEIYPIAQFDEKSNEKVIKDVLVKRWDQLIKGDTTNPKLVATGVDENSLAGLITFSSYGNNTSSLNMLAFKNTHDRQVTGSSINYSNDTSPELLLGEDKKVQILELLQNKVTSFTYDNGGLNQYITFSFPFGYSKKQIRSYEITIRDMKENKNSKIIVSPSPTMNYMRNEVVTLSVENLIMKKEKPYDFKKGMIQIKDITNATNVQLGEGRTASYIATKKSNMIFANKINKRPYHSIVNASYAHSK